MTRNNLNWQWIKKVIQLMIIFFTKLKGPLDIFKELQDLISTLLLSVLLTNLLVNLSTL